MRQTVTLAGRLDEVCELVKALLNSESMADLWRVHDAGMPVFVHTVDVTLLAMEYFPDWQSRYGDMDAASVCLGSLLHDLTKATCRTHRQFTHSWLMSNEPDAAAKAAMDALDSAQIATGIGVDYTLAEHVSHIVASHHGPWGKIRPATPEADLVYWCDLFSAQHHRLAPLDANDILPLLAYGSSRAGAARALGVSASAVRSRLLESCAVEGAKSVGELVAVWQARGSVRLGGPQRTAQLAQAKLLVSEARRAPQTVVKALLAAQGARS